MRSLDLPVLEAVLQEGTVLCTLIAVEGGFSRAVGAQIAVTKDGRCVGDMTGGCLEAALLKDAETARATGESKIVRYGKGSRYIDIQLPCGGGVELYVDASPDVAIACVALESLNARQSASYTFSLGKESEWLTTGTEQSRDIRYFRKDCHPTARLLIFGNGPEVIALNAIAEASGCETDVMTPKGQGSIAGNEIFLGKSPQNVMVDPLTAIILLFHDHEWEDAILKWALASEAFYVGALGGMKAVDRRSTALSNMGTNMEALSRLHGPIGLIPFARDADMLAISILAEVAQCYGLLTGQLTK